MFRRLNVIRFVHHHHHIPPTEIRRWTIYSTDVVIDGDCHSNEERKLEVYKKELAPSIERI